MAGACILAVSAALRMGLGLARIACLRSLYGILASALPEAVFDIVEDTEYFTQKSIDNLAEHADSSDAVLIGCGLGLKQETREFVCSLVERLHTPILLDADGINAVSEHISVLDRTQSSGIVVTPHPKEMSRLTGKSVAYVQKNREQTAADFAREHGLTVVLKGRGRVIAAPGVEAFVNPTGNPGLATGGSGDVLAGMTASLMAQGVSPHDSAVCAAFIHGSVADVLASKTSEAYLLPSDLVKGMYLWNK